uniref:Uncharacterized protein n=1 Tax=Aegilops tauschii subsp. strangulata TaxID=200361 RepID=A0A453KDS5_AEGTS
VTYAADLVTARRISLDDGVVWLRHEALRIVLLDEHGRTVDTRFLREGESIEIGGILSFPCHFARVHDRIPVATAMAGSSAP